MPPPVKYPETRAAIERLAATGMSHPEIAAATNADPGYVATCIRRWRWENCYEPIEPLISRERDAVFVAAVKAEALRIKLRGALQWARAA